MSIQVESRIRTDIESINDRESGLCISGKILYVDYDLDLDDCVEEQIGEIFACQITGLIDDLTIWADSISQDLYDAVLWLQQLCRKEDDLAYLSYLLIEKVEIEPKWRGRGITLKAVAAFLEVFAREGFVFLKPAPLQKLESPEEQRKQVERLRKFWERLDLIFYDSEANFLWNPIWQCPKELAGTEDVRP